MRFYQTPVSNDTVVNCETQIDFLFNGSAVKYDV